LMATLSPTSSSSLTICISTILAQSRIMHCNCCGVKGLQIGQESSRQSNVHSHNPPTYDSNRKCNKKLDLYPTVGLGRAC
jgi:hypothetical protein